MTSNSSFFMFSLYIIGPGCSGLGDGLFLEHGPYYPNPIFTNKTVSYRIFRNEWQMNIIY